jgi:outer membrane lipoprotein-sorting protein
MRPNENIKKLITGLKVEASAELDARVHNAIDNALDKRNQFDSTSYRPSIGRIIMRSPITKLAMAAVVIIAVLAGIYLITGKTPAVTCCAWAQIADKVEQIKTCAYRLHVRQTGGPVGQTGQQVEGKVYISSDYGYKMETSLNGITMQQMYMNPGEKAMIIVMPTQKKYMRMALTDDAMAKTKKQMQDPREIINQFMSGQSGQYKELGKDTINGVEVKGIEVNNPPAVQAFYSNFVGRMWVDVATEYPVRMEIEGEMKLGGQDINMIIVMDDFEWGTELSPDLFKPDIPADFTTMGEMKLPNQDEAGAIEGFKLFAEVTDGKYPSQMNAMAAVMEALPALQKKFNPEKSAEPNNQAQQEQMNTTMKLQGPFLFYQKLHQEGNEPAYYGDKVTAEFGDSVLMRWKISDKQYRVIFGNLTVKTVSDNELAALEAMPLNRNPKAVKPKPADGVMCSQIANLELSWMPGMYAVANKVYMGTASDGLSLLADVSNDNNLIVEELKRNTIYYWRVDGTDANGKVTTGDVWSFNTGKLVGWWKFDESTGTIASDSSGNGNNGTLKGNPVWRPTGGVSGGAIELSGKGDYVEISNESAFDINSQITISAWVNITDVPQEWTGIVTKGDSAWRLSTSFAKNIFHFGVSSSAYLNGQATVDSGQWHNVVCVYDGQKMSIYVDGKIDFSRPWTGPIGTNDFPVCIGENIELKGRCFHGLIDDVRIYNYALSQDEITELFNSAHYVTVEAKYIPVEMEFKAPTSFQRWDRKEFAGAQKDQWHITKSGQVEAHVQILITNAPADACVMTLTLPYSDASIISAKQGDSSLSFNKAKTVRGYDITVPVEKMGELDAGQREISLVWTMPLDKLEKAPYGYRAELAGLIPVSMYKLTIVLDEGCGYVFSKDPSRSEFMAFYQDGVGETSWEPKSYFGSCGIPVKPVNQQ